MSFFHPQKWYFAIFSQIPKSGWNTGVGDGDGDGENFLMGKCCKNEMTYIGTSKKNLSDFSNVKFFTVDPYFRGISKVEQPKSAKNSTFGHF